MKLRNLLTGMFVVMFSVAMLGLGAGVVQTMSASDRVTSDEEHEEQIMAESDYSDEEHEEQIM